MTDHYKKSKIDKSLRYSVWNKYCGDDVRKHLCFAGCGRMIDLIDFECGHVISEADGGKTILENLRPICSTCNKSMGKENMQNYMKKKGIKISLWWNGPLSLTEKIKNFFSKSSGEIVNDPNGFIVHGEKYKNNKYAGTVLHKQTIISIFNSCSIQDVFWLINLFHDNGIIHKDDARKYMKPEFQKLVLESFQTPEKSTEIIEKKLKEDDDKICHKIKKNGQRCKGKVSVGKMYCWRHL